MFLYSFSGHFDHILLECVAERVGKDLGKGVKRTNRQKVEGRRRRKKEEKKD